MQSEQTKQMADLSVQSSLKNVDTAEFNWALRIQKVLFAQTRHTNGLFLIATVCGSFFLRIFIKINWIVGYKKIPTIRPGFNFFKIHASLML